MAPSHKDLAATSMDKAVVGVRLVTYLQRARDSGQLTPDHSDSGFDVVINNLQASVTNETVRQFDVATNGRRPYPAKSKGMAREASHDLSLDTVFLAWLLRSPTPRPLGHGAVGKNVQAHMGRGDPWSASRDADTIIVSTPVTQADPSNPKRWYLVTAGIQAVRDAIVGIALRRLLLTGGDHPTVLTPHVLITYDAALQMGGVVGERVSAIYVGHLTERPSHRLLDVLAARAYDLPFVAYVVFAVHFTVAVLYQLSGFRPNGLSPETMVTTTARPTQKKKAWQYRLGSMTVVVPEACHGHELLLLAHFTHATFPARDVDARAVADELDFFLSILRGGAAQANPATAAWLGAYVLPGDGNVFTWLGANKEAYASAGIHLDWSRKENAGVVRVAHVPDALVPATSPPPPAQDTAMDVDETTHIMDDPPPLDDALFDALMDDYDFWRDTEQDDMFF